MGREGRCPLLGSTVYVIAHTAWFMLEMCVWLAGCMATNTVTLHNVACLSIKVLFKYA